MVIIYCPIGKIISNTITIYIVTIYCKIYRKFLCSIENGLNSEKLLLINSYIL